LQCFDTIGWASGRSFGLQKMSDEVLGWLSVWSEVQMIACCPADATAVPSSLASLKQDAEWFSLSVDSLPGLSWKRGR